MFASYLLDQKANGTFWQIGVRNSTEKKFAVGFAAGSHVMVCSNLVFSGDFVEFRKHTKGLDIDELFDLAQRALLNTTGKLQALTNWQQSLKEVNLPPADMRILTFEALRKGAFPAGKFDTFLEAYKDESSRSGDSLYSLHGAMTQTIRDSSLTQISKRSRVINEIADEYKNHLECFEVLEAA